MRMLKHRVATVVCAAALSMIFSRTGAAQMAREQEIIVETQAVYHSRLPLPPPAARSEAKPAVALAGAVWVPGFWNFEGDPKTAPVVGGCGFRVDWRSRRCRGRPGTTRIGGGMRGGLRGSRDTGTSRGGASRSPGHQARPSQTARL